LIIGLTIYWQNKKILATSNPIIPGKENIYIIKKFEHNSLIFSSIPKNINIDLIFNQN